ncbi:Dipeptide and tripeptide permease A [Planctomycetes bacterium Pla163]|uniref:Dipeptide and tripeptide permease A n=1 Tax=Rohdeia mirabilis TaxID=2528008 RepID=A0A518CUR5_9BACT|nr:Dipeptide and tripeptide permease A [Planctomycetes bacterium Pla163]
MAQHLTAPVPSTKLPKGIPYIIGNEAAERFSFYGMKAVLTVFMVSYLHLMGSQALEPMPEAQAEANFHYFTAAVYFTPFLGALLADILFGKYRTIITLSLVYCMGHGALALMGIAGPATYWMLGGLGLIALGSGGIKPCVSAHVGDQFGKSNAHLLTTVFFWFYFSINFGSFISTLLTPWLLEWYGPHWAFGVPGVLMALATLMFWMGRKVFVHIPADGAGFAKELFSPNGLKTVASLFVIYVFVAVFWALFDQTGSSWVLQARDLDRNFLGMELLPSQIQAANPILVLALIPVFSYLIYPAINRVFKMTPIRKIGGGLFVMVTAFALVAWVQGRVDAGESPSIGWQLLAYILLTGSEVMVSITALEFSYTQAPRKMKSVIMAFFLWSVSLGNIFTGQVNSYVQVPSGTAEISAVASQANEWLLDNLGTKRDAGTLAVPGSDELDVPDSLRFASLPIGFTVTAAGHDGTFDNADDISVTFVPNADGSAVKRDVVATAGLEQSRAAVERILEDWRAKGRLPLTTDGQVLIDGLLDPWGEQLTYTLQNRLQFRVLSTGPDRVRDTKFDLGHIVEIDEPSDATSEASTDEKLSWLDQRKLDLGLDDESTRAEGEDADVTAFVGGQTKLEGASYFWFFTWVMLGAALLFIPVGLVYRPKEYLQEEGPAGEA